MDSGVDYASLISGEADKRHVLHENHASSRPFSEGYEAIGMLGEWEFAKLVGVMPDCSLKPKGDEGVDFVVPLAFTVDVKTARKAFNLIHEQGKGFADIYVLAEYAEDGAVSLLGWEWGSILSKAPTKDFGYGVINHYISREKLRPIGSLVARLMRLKHG